MKRLVQVDGKQQAHQTMIWISGFGQLVAVLCVFLPVLSMIGCAAAPTEIKYSLRTNNDADLVWPSAPDVPRYRYIGDLVGEQNVSTDASKTSTASKIFGWLVGLDAQTELPNVLQRPNNGITSDDGRIYVSDVSRQAVMVFDETLGKVDVWESVATGQKLRSPIALQALGEYILVSDADWAKIFKFTLNGEPSGSFSHPDLIRPTGMVVDSARGLIYVADAGAHDIKVLNAVGELVNVIGRKGNGVGEFNAPTFLALYEDCLYISDTLNARIQKLDLESNKVEIFGQRGLYIGDLTRPKGIALDDSGNLYVIESYFDYLIVYDKHGNVLLGIGGSGNAPGQFFQPSGVWVDSHNRVFVADMLNGRVSLFQFLGED